MEVCEGRLWLEDKESSSMEWMWAESDNADWGTVESDGIDSGTVESEIIGGIESRTWLDIGVGLQVEEGKVGEETMGSKNMVLTGISTLGQIWGKEKDDCGEVTEEIKGNTFSWNETSLEMNICLVTKFNNF